MKHADYKEKNIEELKKLVEETSDQIRSFRFDIAMRKMSNHRAIRNARVQLARLKTVLQQKSEE